MRGSHGLSAQRARRTKSRGPQGLQLEVGARRAPRLLVSDKPALLILIDSIDGEDQVYNAKSCPHSVPSELTRSTDILVLE